MWAIDPGSALREASSDDDEPEEEDRRSSASFLRSLGGDDVDDLLNPKPKEPELPELPKSLLQATPPARPKPKDAAQTARYFQQETPEVARSRSSDRSRVCFLCGGADHHAGRCPGEVCFMCLESGHTSRDCPNGGNTSIFLERVRSMTHRAAGGGGEGGGGGEARPDLSQVRCLACGALGHVDCTPDEGWPKNLSCFNCGRDGHSALGCPADGMDRWHKRFAPLASGAARWQARAGGGSSKPGPPPARFMDRAQASLASFRQRGGGGGASSSRRDGQRHTPGGNKPGPPPARFVDRGGGGGGGGGGSGRSGGRGGGRGGFSQPRGIVKPRPSNHVRFS